MTYPIIPVPDDAGEKVEQQGTKRKFWYAGDTLLFKEGRPGTGENWAEKVACEICDLLEIPHAHYEFATWRGCEGVVTKSFLLAGCEYVTANPVLSEASVQGSEALPGPATHGVRLLGPRCEPFT